ncbi:unnamed protein product, partial [Choristocarpus tenellus]
ISQGTRARSWSGSRAKVKAGGGGRGIIGCPGRYCFLGRGVPAGQAEGQDKCHVGGLSGESEDKESQNEETGNVWTGGAAAGAVPGKKRKWCELPLKALLLDEGVERMRLISQLQLNGGKRSEG